jgi:hypothetical protein
MEVCDSFFNCDIHRARNAPAAPCEVRRDYPFNDFTEVDLNDLRDAKSKFEYPGLAARIATLIGKPIEAGFKLLPSNWNEKVADIVQATLFKGLQFAIRTMGEGERRGSRDWLHRVLVTGSGIAGGAIGIASLPVELPISTTIILRSIADIARSEGHDVALLDVKLACLEVFALGGRRSAQDNFAGEGYWVVRAALARAVSEAAAYIAQRGVAEEGAPPLVRLLAAIASRFSIVVTEEVAAMAVPVVGAAAGGIINYLFMDHFQEMARGHFIIKRLEKKHGAELVERAYKELVIY